MNIYVCLRVCACVFMAYHKHTYRSDFHIIDSLLIAVHAFVNLVSMSFSICINLSILPDIYPAYIYI